MSRIANRGPNSNRLHGLLFRLVESKSLLHQGLLGWPSLLSYSGQHQTVSGRLGKVLPVPSFFSQLYPPADWESFSFSGIRGTVAWSASSLSPLWCWWVFSWEVREIGLAPFFHFVDINPIGWYVSAPIAATCGGRCCSIYTGILLKSSEKCPATYLTREGF